ncbi:MAG: acetyl-CoA C-acetyltransferase [Planctomycetes bacterium]|nr:acetyl-CoA C-acetyltransferase [Planctomycetota bacterium]
MTEVVLLSACRTAIGRFQGSLAGFRAPELGAIAVREAVKRAGIEASAVQEVILGNVLQAGVGQNPARQAARGAGIPDAVGAFTVNKVCGSGLKSVMLAAQAIRAGDAQCIVAGGMESMSRAPYLLPQAREGQRLGHGQLVDAMIHDGLWDIYNDFHMGMTAELVAKKYEISRAEQDAFSARSQARAAAAQAAGKFKHEIVPVAIPQKKGDPLLFQTDEGVRAESTAEALSKLRPAFQKDGGTVTAGNASTINDGAAALVVASADWAAKQGLKPLARIVTYGTGGCAPEWVMMAPQMCVQGILQKMKVGIDHFDLVELNEAFAVASIALQRELGIDPERLNVHGGAVALGHPIGASGARILVTLLHALADRGKQRGLAALCLGGGNAVGVAIERL